MDFFQATTLALVQGLTEFLPVSSSAHLILMPTLMEWSDQGLAFDVATHLGTLCAVVFHWRQHIVRACRLDPLAIRWVFYVVAASIPVLVAGYLTVDIVERHLRSPLVIATTSIAFGLLLWAALWYESRLPATSSSRLDLKSALLIGASQILALVPGTSRAGITITAGLFLGLQLRTAVQLSFGLAIPVILTASLYQGVKLTTMAGPSLASWPMLALGFCVSAVVAFATIRLILALLSSIGLLPFIIYRLVLGVVLLVVFL